MTFCYVDDLIAVRDSLVACPAALISSVESGFIPTYLVEDRRAVLLADLKDIPISWTIQAAPGELELSISGSRPEFGGFWSTLVLRNEVVVRLPPLSSLQNLAGIFAALRGLGGLGVVHLSAGVEEVHWLGGVIVLVPIGTEVAERARLVSGRIRRGVFDRSADMTKSAYYMGSKFSLSSFLLEAVGSFVDPGSEIVDLMCGAGAAAKAFSLSYDVIACDAMKFCVHLASGIGRADGVNAVSASLGMLERLFEKNARALEELCSNILEEESGHFHSIRSFAEGSSEVYSDFCAQTPRFPSEMRCGKWQPLAEISLRRSGGRVFPYCLITSYYGNLFFGFRQALELDSIRYAVDGVVDPVAKRIFMAALIATASYLGTGYASQFAQPLSIRGLGRREFTRLLEKRASPVFPEFLARAFAIGSAATKSAHRVEGFNGRWQDSLTYLAARAEIKPSCVYLDAPYTRDEYARYYHVLETLASYNYPDVSGKAAVPTRGKNGLFQSEFFTRNEQAIPELLSDIIAASASVARYCAWSYSSRGRARIEDVIDRVSRRGLVVCSSFVSEHRYQPQGGRGRSNTPVLEYLVVFRKQDNSKD